MRVSELLGDFAGKERVRVLMAPEALAWRGVFALAVVFFRQWAGWNAWGWGSRIEDASTGYAARVLVRWIRLGPLALQLSTDAARPLWKVIGGKLTAQLSRLADELDRRPGVWGFRMWVMFLALALAAALGIVTVARAEVGIEYAGSAFSPPARAESYRGYGLKTAKLANVDWGNVQTFARPWWCKWWGSGPGCEPYTWSAVDAQMMAWQAAGIVPRTVTIRAKGPLAAPTDPLPAGLGSAGQASAPPRDLTEWQRFVFALVERYDGDGIDDAPGWKSRVEVWQVESEQQSRWWYQGSALDYLQQLAVAGDAIHAADAGAVVQLGGINPGDLLDDRPSDAELDRRLNAKPEEGGKPEPWRSERLRAWRFMLDTIKRPDLFGSVDVHCWSSWTGCDELLRRTRELLKASGGEFVPIDVGDVLSGPYVTYQPAFDWNPPLPPDRLNLRLAKLLQGDPAETAAYRREQAVQTARKLAVALGTEKVKRANVCCLEDWPLTSGVPFEGLTDASGAPRPALRVVQAIEGLLQQGGGYLSGFRRPTDPGVYAFNLDTTSGRPIVLAWADKPGTAVKIETNLPAGVSWIQYPLPIDGRTALQSGPAGVGAAIEATLGPDPAAFVAR